jgi:hypothetical protein
MVFDKPPCNNKEVSLYFLRKLWEELFMGHHVNYFDIGDFQGVGQGSTQDQEHARCDPMLGPHPPRKRPDPSSQLPLLQRDSTCTSSYIIIDSEPSAT